VTRALAALAFVLRLLGFVLVLPGMLIWDVGDRVRAAAKRRRLR